jgi:hypothetical protein
MTGNSQLRSSHNPAARIGALRPQPEFTAGNHRWRELFEQDISTLFFLALLITGDIATAESALVASMDVLDAELTAGRAADLDEVKRAVVKSSVVLMRQTHAPRVETPSPLPLELQPLLRLDPDLRSCFVLRILARYSNRDCALLLDLAAADVEMLAQTALLGLSAAAQAGGTAFGPYPLGHGRFRREL